MHCYLRLTRSLGLPRCGPRGVELDRDDGLDRPGDTVLNGRLEDVCLDHSHRLTIQCFIARRTKDPRMAAVAVRADGHLDDGLARCGSSRRILRPIVGMGHVHRDGDDGQ